MSKRTGGPEYSAMQSENTSLIVIVTGMSGAGRSTALKALEDLGYEAVDNLPLSLSSLPSPGNGSDRPLAIGVDARTRDFGAEPFLEEIDVLIGREDLKLRLLFLDCDSEVLRRRFSETRRRHQSRPDRRVIDGIQGERRCWRHFVTAPTKSLDTTDMAISHLRCLESNYGLDNARLRFSLLHLPTAMVFHAKLIWYSDVRFLKNPHYEENLRGLTGRDALIGEFIKRDAGFKSFLSNLTNLLSNLTGALWRGR